MKKNKINIGDRLESYLFRFKYNNENWCIIIMIKEGSIIGLFAGNLDELAAKVPEYVFKCTVVKNINKEGISRFDLLFKDKSGYTVTVEGISRAFAFDFSNYMRHLSEKLEDGISVHDLITKEIPKELLNPSQEILRETLIFSLKEVLNLLEQRKLQMVLNFNLESA